MKIKTGNPGVPKAPRLIGESEQAPGLKQRDRAVLNKALGLDQSAPTPSPIHLAAIADNHPDPSVRKAAASALSKLSFKLNPRS